MRSPLDNPRGQPLRSLLRAPTWLYRMHAGWLLGNRFVCIRHRGRRTGQPHLTVVEVVQFDRAIPEVVVISGWGAEAQWYLNIKASPAHAVTVGRRRWPCPQQRFLDETERLAVLERYAENHSFAAHVLARVFGLRGLGPEDLASLAARVRAVAFRPGAP